jgi:hypothetical protein
VVNIADGRRGLAVRGKTEKGLVSYYLGLDGVKSALQEAMDSGDANAMVLVEHAYLSEELRHCDPADTTALGSLTAATDSFDDALRALSAVTDRAMYRGVDLACPRNAKYRVDGMPKDACHLACIAHRTRLKNFLTVPGLNPIEKSLFKQRGANMTALQDVYFEMQQKILGGERS